MNERHRRLVVVDRVLDRLPDQPIGALARHWLDADARRCGEADLLDAHFLDEEIDDLLCFGGIGVPFDAGVDVLRILAEDHHVDLLGLLDRRRNSLEVADGAQANVEVELLAQRNIERANAPTHRRREGALDRHDIVLEDVQCFIGQPYVVAVDAGRFLAGVDFHPVDLPLAAVGLRDRRVDHPDHHRRDVETGAIALDVGDDRVVRDVEARILVDGDLLAAGRNLDMLEGHGHSLGRRRDRQHDARR